MTANLNKLAAELKLLGRAIADRIRHQPVPPQQVTAPASREGLATLLGDLARLLADTADAQQGVQPALSSFLLDFRQQRLLPLLTRVGAVDSPRYVVALVGLTNVGKSTLAQALLQHAVAPRSNQDATAVLVEYEHALRWSLSAHFAPTQHVQEAVFDSAEDLAKRLVQFVFHGTSERPNRVFVRGPMPLLKDGLVLADSPGWGAARAGLGDTYETALAQQIDEHVDEVLFCVRGDTGELSSDVVACFNAVRALCSTVVVTRWQKTGEAAAEARARFLQTYAPLLSPLCKFIFVEAKLAVASLDQGDAALLDQSNIEALSHLIQQRSTAPQRHDVLMQQIMAACDDFEALAQPVINQAGITQIPWHASAHANAKRSVQDSSLHLRIPL